MKIFQIQNGICYWDATEQYPTLDSTVGSFPEDVVFIEAPDYVKEGWFYRDGEFYPPNIEKWTQLLDYQGLAYFAYKNEKTYTQCVKENFVLYSDWTDKTTTLHDPFFKASDDYVYFIAATESSRTEYANCGVRPLDITIEGTIAFKADVNPSTDLDLTIVRMKVK